MICRHHNIQLTKGCRGGKPRHTHWSFDRASIGVISQERRCWTSQLATGWPQARTKEELWLAEASFVLGYQGDSGRGKMSWEAATPTHVVTAVSTETDQSSSWLMGTHLYSLTPPPPPRLNLDCSIFYIILSPLLTSPLCVFPIFPEFVLPTSILSQQRCWKLVTTVKLPPHTASPQRQESHDSRLHKSLTTCRINWAS